MVGQRTVDARLQLRPCGLVVGLQLGQHGLAFVVAQRGQPGAADRRGGQRQARAHVHAERQRAGAARVFDVDHAEAVACTQRHRRTAERRQVLHQRPCQLAQVQPRQHGAAQRQRGNAQPVAAAVGHLDQVAQAHQGARQPRHRALGQAAAFGQVLVAQLRVARAEAGQHLQPARQRGDEVAVFRCGPGLGRRGG
jgi:hypothetical protein